MSDKTKEAARLVSATFRISVNSLPVEMVQTLQEAIYEAFYDVPDVTVDVNMRAPRPTAGGAR